jgi:hypothetical protein
MGDRDLSRVLTVTQQEPLLVGGVRVVVHPAVAAPAEGDQVARGIAAALGAADPVVDVQGPGDAISGAPLSVPQPDVCE